MRSRIAHFLAYSAFSKARNDIWLKIEATPVGGMGILKDMGEMKWDAVDRMPALIIKPITPGISISINNGTRTVGPEGMITRAAAGHVYAVWIVDDRTDYRAIFRIDSIGPTGDCSISWKRVPVK